MMKMDEEPIDLGPLDPTADRDGWERRISAITARAAPALARRSALTSRETSPAQVLLGWFRPALSAAAVLALCAGAALVLLLKGTVGAPEPAPVMAQTLRLPAPVALWLGEEQPPSVADLATAVEGGKP